MDRTLRILIAQINVLVGDVQGNVDRILQVCRQGRDDFGADLVVFPELAVTGYPPEDLLLRPSFLHAVDDAMRRLADGIEGLDAVVGHPHRAGGRLHNAASFIHDGRRAATYFKHLLPNYGVFDERRYFEPGERPCVVESNGIRFGLTICEDLWQPGPTQQAAAAGAQLLININASPYHLAKDVDRLNLLKQRALECGAPIIYANLVGGQDELVFDGESVVVDAGGALIQRAPAFREGLFPIDVRDTAPVSIVPGDQAPSLSSEQSIYAALVLGVRDYVEKNGFSGVVIGLSGGIDSALTLALAADAVGPENVQAVLMPSRYTAKMSVEDALAECAALGVKADIISIEPAFGAFVDSLKEVFEGRVVGATEENIQARCRGVILMAISNNTGRLVLTTGNKSEMAVGYATLYGDMAGGFAPLKDVSKTFVYRLARYRNTLLEVIPQRVLERAPSAELAPEQKDEDVLPPYSVLDPILELYIDQDKSITEIAAAGYDRDTVARVARMVDRNEYKRRQAPPGIKVTRRAFGRDRRYPITFGAYESERAGG